MTTVHLFEYVSRFQLQLLTFTIEVAGAPNGLDRGVLVVVRFPLVNDDFHLQGSIMADGSVFQILKVFGKREIK